MGRETAPSRANACRFDPPTRRIAAIAALVLALPLAMGWKITGTRVEERPYPIAGRTHAELVGSVRRHGPMGAYGVGIIDFHPHFETAARNGRCVVSSAETGLTVQLRIPEWRGDKAAPARVQRVARNFQRAVRAHELQHVAIAKRYQSAMTAALRRLKPADNCWKLRTAARELIAAIKKQHLGAQRAFDRRTLKQIRRLL